MSDSPRIRVFETGATRDGDAGKLDYEGYLHPTALRRYAEYMYAHQLLPDGSRRGSDNWQRGIPVAAYVKSLLRHVMETWEGHRAGTIPEDAVCGVIFNAMGVLYELLRARGAIPAPPHDSEAA